MYHHIMHSAGKSYYMKFDFCDCTRKFGFVITFEIVLWLKLHVTSEEDGNFLSSHNISWHVFYSLN